MASSPATSFVIRSREYNSGSDFNGSDDNEVIPSQYVKRIWRERATVSEDGSRTIRFINKTSADRTVLYCATESGNKLTVWPGATPNKGAPVGGIEWSSQGRNFDRSMTSLGNKSSAFKDMIKRASVFSPSRIFVNPDTDVEYKWKVLLEGDNPIFPDATYRTLHKKNIAHPLATTSRLVGRDGEQGDEAYPIYIAEDALPLEPWIIATTMILEIFDRYKQ
ncbi:hypothetical protein CYLTODRAFT_485995 [Cylindrobasidium torrendii FP15055 ss-10]|uniref:Uncharacterized protein n=1 Tax=Cylindrobasidium torrendii FP15055 ss-10 TaxID=1314674 RepID=A0A0D7BQQ8_9AGAR|nr:hypothetical protein CYLTODRAFT_485995 [Cylindrobasidium torrendii FP15055 ss-10]